MTSMVELDPAARKPNERQNEMAVKALQTPMKKTIKKRLRNRYGTDTRHMGFQKQYVVNE